MNPFAAPEHDSPAPVEASRKHQVLGALGVVETLLGAALMALALLGGGAQIIEDGTLTSEESRENVRFMVAFTAMGGLSVFAGYKLTHRTSRLPLLLQVFPAMVAFIAFYVARAML